jgi:hypothetical protein
MNTIANHTRSTGNAKSPAIALIPSYPNRLRLSRRASIPLIWINGHPQVRRLKGLALSVRALSRLAQNEEPWMCGGEAGKRGELGQTEVAMTKDQRRLLYVLIAGAVAAWAMALLTLWRLG